MNQPGRCRDPPPIYVGGYKTNNRDSRRRRRMTLRDSHAPVLTWATPSKSMEIMYVLVFKCLIVVGFIFLLDLVSGLAMAFVIYYYFRHH